MATKQNKLKSVSKMIDFSEWTEESLIIQVHAIVAILGFAIGLVVFAMRKGTKRHKLVGRSFALMAVLTALTSFFIHEIRTFWLWSPIHLLSILTLMLVWSGIAAIRAGNVQRHQRAMVMMFLSGFVVAGGFTFLPGRMMNEVFVEPTLEQIFASNPDRIWLASAAIPAIALIVALWVFRRQLRS